LSSTCPDSERYAAHRSRVIAHRGASGYVPEHSLAAKTLAYGLGADFLEQDVVATRDKILVVLHDTYLDDVSDVAARFPNRARTDGRCYVLDFALAELEQLACNERRAPSQGERAYPARFPYNSSLFKIVPFEEEIRLIGGLNTTTGRSVGLYPEIKDPEWHAQHGIDLTQLVHRAMERNRRYITGPVFLQSFDAGALQRLRDEFSSEWPRVQLLTAQDASSLTRDPGRIADIASYARGVGLPYQSLIETAAPGKLRASALCLRLLDSKLLVHPYTLRRDAADGGERAYREALEFLICELRVDAIFCDQPDDAIAIRDGA
jgi:glycerophosphoryl diester phosphodiesterase